MENNASFGVRRLAGASDTEYRMLDAEPPAKQGTRGQAEASSRHLRHKGKTMYWFCISPKDPKESTLKELTGVCP
jgi:hypothetical protein